jgi:mRNA-degrading endonuclease toxin of MazEF toxin-antitoxin module
LVSGRNVTSICDTFEVYCEIENRKLKVLVSEIHTISKEKFFGRAIYLGKMKKEQGEEVNEKLRLILKLNN